MKIIRFGLLLILFFCYRTFLPTTLIMHVHCKQILEY